MPEPTPLNSPWMWRRVCLALAALVLLAPLVAMIFTSEVAWDAADFAAAAGLLLTTWFARESVWSWVSRRGLQIAASLLVVLLALAVWAELAVGILD